MKSAYELAMERLEKDDPSTAKVSDEQKAELEEIAQTFKARIAEREVFLQGKIAAARSKGDLEETQALERELRDEKNLLELECEEKKDAVRNR